jgi:hypothetical protein
MLTTIGLAALPLVNNRTIQAARSAARTAPQTTTRDR